MFSDEEGYDRSEAWGDDSGYIHYSRRQSKHMSLMIIYCRILYYGKPPL